VSIGLVVAICYPAATVESDSTVFFGWDVGLGCDGLSLLVLFVLVICAFWLRLGSLFVITFAFIIDWGKARVL